MQPSSPDNAVSDFHKAWNALTQNEPKPVILLSLMICIEQVLMNSTKEARGAFAGWVGEKIIKFGEEEEEEEEEEEGQ